MVSNWLGRTIFPTIAVKPVRRRIAPLLLAPVIKSRAMTPKLPVFDIMPAKNIEAKAIQITMRKLAIPPRDNRASKLAVPVLASYPLPAAVMRIFNPWRRPSEVSDDWNKRPRRPADQPPITRDAKGDTRRTARTNVMARGIRKIGETVNEEAIESDIIIICARSTELSEKMDIVENAMIATRKAGTVVQSKNWMWSNN